MSPRSDVPTANLLDPSDTKHHRDIVRWGTDAITEAEGMLRSQSGFNSIDDTISAIMGENTGEAKPASLSSLSLNQFGKVALDLVANQTDIKPFWDYKTSNTRFDQQAQMSQKLARSWWNRQHIGMRLADVLWYGNVAGTGYSHHIWNPDIEDQDVIAEDPRDVLPIRPGSFRSIQECFGVIIRRERTLNYVKAKCLTGEWKESAIPLLRPDRDASFAAVNRSNRVSKLLSSMGLKSGFVENLYASLGGKPAAQSMNIPTLDVFTCYVKDPSENETSHVITMGLDPSTGKRTNWSYDVLPGEMLYPRKRCIIFTRSAVLYDDASIYWHGMFPITKLTIDPKPWSWLGKAPLKDLLPLHAELNRLMRTLSQHWSRVERPGLIADKNSISHAAMERIDTARAGLKLRHNPLAGKGAEMVFEPPLDPSFFPTVQFLIQQMRELSGIGKVADDITQLDQIPTTETVEKLLAATAQINRLRSQVLESYIAEFGLIVLMNFFQFYTLPMRLSVLGPSGITWEDFDFDPGTLIPDSLNLWPHRDRNEPEATRDMRAREFIKQFVYEIAPGSLLASASVTEKLMYVMLAKMGAIDLITMLEKLSVPNIGAPEEAGTTIYQRMAWQMQNGVGMAVNAQGRKATDTAGPRIKMTNSASS